MNQRFVSSLHFPEYIAGPFTEAAPLKGKGAGFFFGDGVELSPCDASAIPAREELEGFLEASGIPLRKGKPKLILEKDSTLSGEDNVLTAGCGFFRIAAGTSAGFRRGACRLERRLRSVREPELAPGRWPERVWVETRLARCCYGPTKRAPFYHDELLEDTDYYPDAYLKQLSHENVNGLWLTVKWRELAETSFEAPDANRERRLAKLRATVEKCARYGIKVWIFCIEPFNFEAGDTLGEAHPELLGAPYYNKIAFCPSTEAGKRYIRESAESIFRAVPGLGGMLNISLGERGTTCLSSLSPLSGKERVNCPNCTTLPKHRILWNSLEAMMEGMRKASPDARLISWLYIPNNAPFRARWVNDLAAHVPPGVIVQYNFESGGRVRQLGKDRAAGDYWLSYAGPSVCFSRFARTARRHGTPLSAKLQAGGSLELETIPSLPVPALLYRKYRRMKRLGVSHCMQSWLFGSKPGILSEAAGLLSGWDFAHSEKEFLTELARPYWKEHAEDVAEAWKCFSEGYKNFPVCFMFQYYSPVQNGITWPLHLMVRNLPLAPVWKPDFPVSGDAIGECLQNHDLDEAILLMETVSRKWLRGMRMLEPLREKFRSDPECMRQFVIAEAAGIQFESAQGILNFYRLRSRLADREYDFTMTLGQMKKIVLREIELRTRMLELIRLDGTLGYQSEAEIYLYDAEKIAASVDSLKCLLETEFPQVERDSRTLFPELSRDLPEGEFVESKTYRWRLRRVRGKWKFELEILNPTPDMAFGIALMDRFGIESPRFVWFSNQGKYVDRIGLEKWNYTEQSLCFDLPEKAFMFKNDALPRMSVTRVEHLIDDFSVCESTPPCASGYTPRLRLYLWYFNPSAMFELTDLNIKNSKKGKDET